MNTRRSIVWFRQDLRLEDNPALLGAIREGRPVIPVFFRAPDAEGRWAPGAASRWWLHHSLAALDRALRKHGSRLILRNGSFPQGVLSFVRETGASSVFFNRRNEPAARKIDEKISAFLTEAGIAVKTFNASLLLEPSAIRTQAGKPFQVFTAFWRACLASRGPELPGPVPRKIPPPAKWPASLPLKKLGLLPKRDWAQGMKESWRPGEAGARKSLAQFLRRALSDYPAGRDIPSDRGTSRLSPYLHFGEISPRRLWHEVLKHSAKNRGKPERRAAEVYLRQLGWREFSKHLLYHFPHTAEMPLREKFNSFRWKKNDGSLQCWQEGRTGYPVVDAGMRELWRTGWMHNRVRMIAASFLVKDLLLSWQEGAKWFWDTLVDADLANNTLGWQWCAGCGADAAPFFRIFNPVLQGERFDPQGKYVRKWIPELAKMPEAWIHKPWEAPEPVLKKAGVRLGKNYPRPVIAHASARQRALAVYSRL